MSIDSDHRRDANSKSESRPRLDVVDLLRGVAIVLMALDHVREFLQAEQVDPTDLSHTTVPLFLTRWITHFCPSIFVLLAGVGISLGMSGRKSRWQQSQFVLARGLWLVVLELTAVHVGWFFNFHLNAALGQVIWAIGWSMVGVALLLFLSDRYIAAIGIVLILGHNALDGIPSSRFGSLGWVWTMLHAGGPISFGKFFIYIAYPVVPWVGVMAAGVGFGHLLRLPRHTRCRLIPILGLAMILLFAILRGGNFYGNPGPWIRQSTPAMTMLSILNCHKYPPSLSFLLMTLGPTFVVWPLLEHTKGRFANFLIVFGRVPMFFYLAHLFVVHALTIGIVYAQVRSFPNWLWDFPPGHAGPGCGVSLPVLYLIWIGVVLFHYPLCLWYGAIKNRYPKSFLRFL